MFKKIIISFIVFTTMLTGCKKDNMVNDMKALMNENINIHEQFLSSITSSNNGKDLSVAINKYAEATVLIMKKSKELEIKYPSIREKTDFPELKDVHEKMKLVSRKISKTMGMVMQKYKNDKDVKAAMDNLAKKIMVPMEAPADMK